MCVTKKQYNIGNDKDKNKNIYMLQKCPYVTKENKVTQKTQ